MKFDPYEVLKRYELNKTEPETLMELIHSAKDKGDKVVDEQKTFRKAAEKLYEYFSAQNLIRTLTPYARDEVWGRCAIGVDGSFYPIEGVGGKWYAPMSAARIAFEKGFGITPQVEVAADIEELPGQEYTSPLAEFALRMMLVETKFINNCAMKYNNALLFIDGPIVDPPLCRDKDYIHRRCTAIKECFKREITVIGCAKRVKDTHLKKYLSSEQNIEKNILNHIKKFPNDLQMVVFVFTEHWKQKGKIGTGILFTAPINMTSLPNNKIYETYLAEGIAIYSCFIQLDPKSYLLRLDIPFLSNDDSDKDVKFNEIVNLVAHWTYPGHDIPLPVFLAHEKCNIRKGCAEVLYDEILTRAQTVDPFDQIALLQLR